MKQGFVKVAAVTPDIRVADVEFNKEQICRKRMKRQRLERRLSYFRSSA